MAPIKPWLLDFQNVSVQRGARMALQHLTLQIPQGQHVAILGPNGSGKSTLIKTITAECYPSRGTVTLFGQSRWNVFDLRSRLGIVSYDLLASCSRDLTAEEILLSGFFSSIGLWPGQQVTPGMKQKTRKILHQLEIPDLAHRSMMHMSSGEARRVLIGRALVHDPTALLFDEPTNSLDIRAAHEIRILLRRLARQGTSILVVTHHLEDVIPEIERVVLLQKGRLLQEGSKEKLLTGAVLSRLFGLRISVHLQKGRYILI